MQKFQSKKCKNFGVKKCKNVGVKNGAKNKIEKIKYTAKNAGKISKSWIKGRNLCEIWLKI